MFTSAFMGEVGRNSYVKEIEPACFISTPVYTYKPKSTEERIQRLTQW